MNVHVVIGTEPPHRLSFTERPRVGDAVVLPDGRTVVVNQFVHDLMLDKLRVLCQLTQAKKKK